MLGWFKRKPNAFEIDDRSKEVAMRSAAVLRMNLMLCRSLDNYQVKLKSDAVRGYLVGFMDGASQMAGLKLRTDQEFFAYLGVGHMFLLEDEVPNPGAFTLDSIALQGTRKFDEGQAMGGGDYFAWMKDKERQPVGLLSFFHDAESK